MAIIPCGERLFCVTVSLYTPASTERKTKLEQLAEINTTHVPYLTTLFAIIPFAAPPHTLIQLQAPNDIEGGADRRCTDVLFMIILAMTWIAMTYLGVDAISNGNPELLVNGIDYEGRICGVDDAVKDKSKVGGSGT